MTASAAARRRATQIGGGIALVAAIFTVVAIITAVSTLRSSNEGRSPEADDRIVVAFPQTPNAAVGIVDDLDRLTSLAVFTLHPSGVGGSLVVVPVNVDTTNGFGPEREPVSRFPYAPGDEADADLLTSNLEPLLTLTIERAVVLGPDELTDVLEPLAPFEVDLPDRVVDFDSEDDDTVAPEGPGTLDVDEMVAAFTAISAAGDSYDHHDIDVALWSAVVEAAVKVPAVTIPLDDVGRPVPPTSAEELIGRMFAGEIGLRDLRINVSGTASADNADDADFVIGDRRDALMVFGAISPGLVSKPNESLAFKLVVAFDDAQVSALGEEADGTTVTKESMILRFIGELLFEQANVVAVDLADAPETLPQRTQMFVADESFVESVRAASPRFFGDADITVADEVTDGVDVVVVLGTDFLAKRAELIAAERAEAEAEPADDDGSADFEIAPDVTVSPDGSTPDGSTPDGSTIPADSTDPEITPDTVDEDG